jgi:hypothetical protein
MSPSSIFLQPLNRSFTGNSLQHEETGVHYCRPISDFSGNRDQETLEKEIDIISFGICPAVVLLSFGHFSPWFIPGAFIIVATGVIRLSYFNVFGLVDESTYMGLAILPSYSLPRI